MNPSLTPSPPPHQESKPLPLTLLQVASSPPLQVAFTPEGNTPLGRRVRGRGVAFPPSKLPALPYPEGEG